MGKRKKDKDTTVYQNPTLQPIQPLTQAQDKYIKAVNTKTITYGVGAAGTGKSFIAATYAIDQLYYKRISQIVLTRPGVDAGESYGYLPGSLDDKIEPYLAPVLEIFEERVGKSTVEYYLKRGYITASPLGFMRGKTFKDCVVLFDEAQNSTPEQMKLFLTRIGENCKVIIDGDVRQKDIKSKSGLQDSIDRLATHPEVAVVEFGNGDVVRSGIVRDILRLYEKPQET